MKIRSVLILLVSILALVGCNNRSNTESKTAQAVQAQQAQYLISQPVPSFPWSLERDMMIQLYGIRNLRAVTHSVWRSDLGTVEGDCPSIGFGIPYDTSLTNPLVATDINSRGDSEASLTSIEQPEPNGVFASKNTAATWVMCAGDNGNLDPIYVETKVTAYPYPVTVDYETNRVIKAGKSTVTIKMTK